MTPDIYEKMSELIVFDINRDRPVLPDALSFLFQGEPMLARHKLAEVIREAAEDAERKKIASEQEGRFKTIAKYAEYNRMTIRQYLRKLASSGEKYETMAMQHGLTLSAFAQAMQRYGIKKPSAYAFEWAGVSDTITGHCRRHGLSMSDVKAGRLKGLGKRDALDYAALCAESRMRRAA